MKKVVWAVSLILWNGVCGAENGGTYPHELQEGPEGKFSDLFNKELVDYLSNGNDPHVLLEFMRTPAMCQRKDGGNGSPQLQVSGDEVERLKAQISSLKAQLSGQMPQETLDVIEGIKKKLQATYGKRSSGADVTRDLQDIMADMDVSREVALSLIKYMYEEFPKYIPGGVSPNPATVDVLSQFQNLLGQTQRLNIKKASDAFETEQRDLETLKALDEFKPKYDALIARGRSEIAKQASERSPALYFLLFEPGDALRKFLKPDLIRSLYDTLTYASKEDLEILLYHFGKNKGFSMGATQGVFEKIEETLREYTSSASLGRLAVQPVQLSQAKENSDLTKSLPQVQKEASPQLLVKQETNSTPEPSHRIDAFLARPEIGKFDASFKKRLAQLKGREPAKIDDVLDLLEQYISSASNPLMAEISWKKIQNSLKDLGV